MDLYMSLQTATQSADLYSQNDLITYNFHNDNKVMNQSDIAGAVVLEMPFGQENAPYSIH